MQFVAEDTEPILRLKPEFLMNELSDSTYYMKFELNSELLYDPKLKIIYFKNENFPITLRQERKEGITSLVDLENTVLFVTNKDLNGGDFDPERALAIINLKLPDRYISFGCLFAYSPDEVSQPILKKKNVITSDPFFFFWDIDSRLLRGDQKSLRYDDKDSTRTGCTIGMWTSRF